MAKMGFDWRLCCCSSRVTSRGEAKIVSQSTRDNETNDIVINSFASSEKYEYHFPVNFNTSEWYAAQVRIIVTARQNYVPTFRIVNLLTSINYGGGGTSTLTEWSVFDHGDSKIMISSYNLNYSRSGENAYIKLRYSVPEVAVLPAILNFTVETIITFVSKVPIPNTIPPAEPPPSVVTDSGENPPGFDFFGYKVDPKYVLLGVAALVAIVVIKPSAPVQLLSSGYDAVQSRRRRK